jgi:hypothetical protein
MATIILPDAKDAEALIADYLATMDSAEGCTPAERNEVIENCIAPITWLIKAEEAVRLHGGLEEQVFFAFMRDISAQIHAIAQQSAQTAS